MAYFLRFDGVNDYVTLASTINISTTDDFSIKWRWPTTSSGNHRVLGGGSVSSSSSRIIHFANGNITVYGGTGGNVGFSQATDQSIDREIELRRVAGSLSLHYDGQQQGPAQNSSQSFTFGVLGANFSTVTVVSDLYNIEFEVNGQAISFYDPSASNGTGSILPDTAGGNDGTLINFPTDDSQWVFYSDAIGITSDVAYTVSAPTFSASASVTIPAPNADVSFSIPSPQFSAGASVTQPGFSADVSFLLQKPQFSASASVTLPNPQANVSYEIGKPQFSTSASASLPQPVADVDFSLQEPVFSANASVTINGRVADVGFSISKPVFNASASVTLPNQVADVAFTISPPIFSVVAISGGAAIIADDETNINMPSLSTNVEIPWLSTNINR